MAKSNIEIKEIIGDMSVPTGIRYHVSYIFCFFADNATYNGYKNMHMSKSPFYTDSFKALAKNLSETLEAQAGKQLQFFNIIGIIPLREGPFEGKLEKIRKK